MRLCDLSLKAKLLATNALMMAIPICVLVVIGAALLGGLRHTGTLQQQALELLWPEKGSALSVQFALSSLRAQILTPLEEMRIAAAAIQRGDFDRALPPMGNDEVGATCRAFDSMRSELKRARERERQEEQRRRELFIGILHDVATPLTAIKGYASGLLDGIARTPEKRRAYAERISQAAVTMERLTTRLREFLRIEMGQLPLTWETVCARNVLVEAVRECAPDFAEQGLHISMQETDIEAYVRIDCGEFSRVLKNLWENSGKYRRGDTADVHMSLAEEGVFLCIRCDDDGVGVAAQDLPKLFDSFYRTNTARTNVAAGSGLGLAIVRQIVTAFGGCVRAEASPLGGLRVIILLPIVKQGDME